MPKDHGIGASSKRREDVRYLTGRGKYTDDMSIYGQAYGNAVEAAFSAAVLIHASHSRVGHAADDTGHIDDSFLLASAQGRQKSFDDAQWRDSVDFEGFDPGVTAGA